MRVLVVWDVIDENNNYFSFASVCFTTSATTATTITAGQAYRTGSG